jgi:hypothetical protein
MRDLREINKMYQEKEAFWLWKYLSQVDLDF